MHLRLFFTLLCLLVLQACKHPLAIEGQGDIVERLAGVRGCTLEDFQAGAARCVDNEAVAEDYVVSYEAIPRPGWVFTGWEGTACSTVTDEGYCEYSFAQSWIDFTDSTWPGFGFPPTIAVFKLPEDAADPSESIDTDGDGIGNNADTDDDGDGVADVYDYRPLESAVWENPNEILSANALANAPKGIIPEVEVSSDRDAMRLLIQATYGPRPEDFRYFQSMGAAAWFEEQLALPQSNWLDTYRKWRTYWAEQGRPNVSPDQETFWDVTLNVDDQLRQRMILAWSELFVISTTSGLDGYRDAAHSYLDTLGAHAFGNFRDLLEAVTKHAAMGLYLNMLANQKEDAELNIRPDENYAREVMQLFTIGLKELNQDGSPKQDAMGAVIETYTSDTIREYAKVFTGWHLRGTTPEYWPSALAILAEVEEKAVFPMEPVEEYHQKTEKTLLRDYYVPAGQMAEQDLKVALDSLFYHPNLAPFISKFLIQRFVTSNPSPAYIGRVGAVFNDDGTGTRGNLTAVITAVLFDQEARKSPGLKDETFGKFKEPLLRATHIFRMFDAATTGDNVPLFGFERSFGQFILRSRSVFNFFQPDFSPIGEFKERGLAAPEKQIINEGTIVRLLNQIGHMIQYSFGTAWIEIQALEAECEYCPYLNTDEEVELLRDEGAEALVDHLLFYLLSGVDYDPQIKTILLDFIEVNFPNINDEDFGMSGDGYVGVEAQLQQKAAREQVAANIAGLIMLLPEFAIQR
jgi:uncharacterized protein (DUF1800 family)